MSSELHNIYEKEENHSYYNRIKSELNIYAEKWALSRLEVIDDGRESCVLKAISKQYGNVILKKREAVKVISRYMETREDHKVLCSHMKKAKEIFIELITLYPRKMLLHGDLHHYNILRNDHNGYTLIDPKGVIGDPIFDLPRFLLNEMEEEINQALFKKINYAIRVIGEKLEIPTEIIKKTFYIEMAMAECWMVEDGEKANLDRVIFAEKMSNTEIIE